MDISESPTQANDDRDYESARHYEPEPSSSHDEPHTLLDDDTGAVNFGPLSQEAKAPSPVSDILSPVIVDITRRGSWRNRDSQNDESQDVGTTPGRPVIAPPETPVAVMNPFKNKGQGSILRATQLFNATQMSAAKNFSPTSSRPSPNAFPQPFMSTSPADLGTSPLKHRYSNGLSSPSVLKYTSTPIGPPTSLLEATPRPERGDDGIETIPESPPGEEADLPPPRKRRRQELLEEYEPVAVSQERKLFGDAMNRMDSDGSDVDSQYKRRQRVKRIREDAERQLDKISLKLSRDESKRVTSSPPHVPARLVRSPRRRSEERGESAASSNSLPSRIPQSSPPVRPQRGRVVEETSGRALIPESPVAVPESDFAQAIASDDVREVTPDRVTRTQRTSQRPEEEDMPPTQPLSPSRPQHESSPSPPPNLTRTSCPPVPLPNLTRTSSTSSPPIPLPTLNRTSRPPAPPPNLDRAPSPPVKTHGPPSGSSDSALSPLTTTPSPVASPKATTPTPSPQSDCYHLPSSAAFELPPPRPSRRPVKNTYSRAARKSRSRPGSLRESPVLDTDSPDELAIAPVRKPRRSCSARPSEPFGTLFENMAFAISFQEQKEDEAPEEYAARCRASGELTDLVSRAGGRILSDGFTELLGNVGVDTKDSGVELLPEAEGLGFTALLADGHSRKVKYMQALALGLPCLAYQWAMASLQKGVLQEWTPYLLSSGQSATLGGATLSRYLEPYPPSKAKLAEVVVRRKLLLGGSRILLVMKKARGGERGKKAYLLLARILGARVSRVFSVREGRKVVRKGDFEWVYVDEETGSAGQVLGEGGGRSKKKGAEEGTRCLSNELIIQSLIAGRIVEEGERQAHGL